MTNDPKQMLELVSTPAGYIPKWLYDWTGENAECSGCGTISTRADEDGLSLCCGTAIMLPLDRVWKMVLARTDPVPQIDVEALVHDLINWGMSAPKYNDGSPEAMVWRHKLRRILTEATKGASDD